MFGLQPPPWALDTLVDQCERLRAPEIKTDYGSKRRDWDNAVATPMDCSYNPGIRVERQGEVRTMVQERAGFLVAPDADVLESDRIRYRGKVMGTAGVVPPDTFGALKLVNVEEVR